MEGGMGGKFVPAALLAGSLAAFVYGVGVLFRLESVLGVSSPLAAELRHGTLVLLGAGAAMTAYWGLTSR